MKALFKSRSFVVVLLAITCSLLFPVRGEAQTFDFKALERNMQHTAAQIRTHGLNDTIIVSHDAWDEMVNTSTSWGNNFKFKSVHSYVRFFINHAYTPRVIDPYTIRLTYKVYGYSNPATPNVTSAPINDTLTISYKSDSLSSFLDKQYKKYENFHKIMIVLTGFYKIDGANGTPQPIDISSSFFTLYNFSVEGAVVFQQFDKRVKQQGTYYDAYGTGANLKIDKQGVTNDYLPVLWHFNTPLAAVMAMKPVKYELEWTYIDDYSVNAENGTVTAKSPSILKYDFKDNATRIWLDTNYYRIPLIYQKGWVIYRVRLVRPDSVEYKYPIYGPWSLATTSGLVVSVPTASKCMLASAHLNDSLNWQYTVSFAEEGKYKHVMSYYDGMLKNRQSITRFNSLPTKLIATEQIYDYEGRPSISILPTPVNSVAFRYQLNLALNKSTNLPYRPQDFDTVQLFTCPMDVKVPPLSDNSLADIYYSPLNPDKAGFQKFVPDAGGYPFVQTIYSPGYDERVEKQGGAGDTLQIGYNHNIKNDYVGSEQTDLNRLFGTNIGWAGFYRKTVSRDPNGQLSLNVTDYKGKTVMSSMIGLPDTAIHALVSNENLSDTVLYKEDFIAGTTQQVTGNKIIMDKNFFNEAAGNNVAQYVFSFKPFKTFCSDKFLSVKAKFDYTIFDECGMVKGHKDSVLGITGVVASATTDTFFQNPVLGFSMDKGKHSLHKELTINTDDVAIAVDSFMTSAATASCLKTEPWFIKQAVLSKEFPCPQEYKDADVNDCDGKKYAMMQELYPNQDSVYVKKKYGIYKIINGVVVGNGNSDFTLYCGHGTDPSHWATSYPSVVIETKANSVVTVGNWSGVKTISGTTPSAPTGPFVVLTGNDTLHCKYRYQDACVVTMPASVTKAGVVYSSLQQIPVEDFINIFNDNIAAALLPLHPEYCKLLECVNDVFEKKMKSIPDWNIASQLNLLTLSKMINADPLYAAMQSNPVLYPSPFDTLADYAGGMMGLNKMALTLAYCNTTDNNMLIECQSNMFQNEIAADTLINDYVKGKYFNAIRDMYLANRKRYLFNLNPDLAGSGACSVCQPIRMLLVPEPVFPDDNASVVTAINGLTSIGGVNVTPQSTGLSVVNDYLNLISTINMDTLGNYSDSAVNIYVSTSDTVMHVALDSIMSQFVNCIILPGGSLTGVRNYLQNLYNTGQVLNLQFTPAQMLAALVANNIKLDDLCNPYIVNYDGLLTPPENAESGGIKCGGPDLFVNASAFLNGQSFNALKNIGTSYAATLGSGQFEALLTAKLGAASYNVVASLNPAQHLYTLTYTNGSQNVKIFIKAGAGGSCQYPFTANPGETVTLEAMCTKEMFGGFPAGLVGNYSFAVIAKHTTSTSTTLCKLKAWNDKIALNNLGDNPIGECVPCTQMKTLYKQFWDTCKVYDVKATTHPYYGSMLRNFMNYNLKKAFTEDQYLDFVESCALADSMSIKDLVVYNKQFSDSLSAFTFINAVNNLIPVINIIPEYFMKAPTNDYFEIAINLLGIPKNKLRIFSDYITNYPALGTLPNSTFENHGVNYAGSIFVPANTAFTPNAGIFNNAPTAFTISNSGDYSLWNGAFFMPCVLYSVYTPVVSDFASNSRNMQLLESYLYNNVPGSLLLHGIKHTVNSEYYVPEKQSLLHYTYNYQNLPPSNVLDTLQTEYLASGIPLFNGQKLSYGHPAMPGNIQNLYIGDPNTATNNTNYAKLSYILSRVSNYLGGSLFFNGANTINVPVGAGEQLTAYRCSDTAYWYRYFGAGDTLYNVFLKVPAYIDMSLRPGYIAQGYSFNLGEGDSRSFFINLKNPNAPIANLQLNGFTDFTVAKNKVLHNVLLTHSVDEGIAVADTVNDCERSRLISAVNQGKTDYRIYVDSVKSRLTSDFMAHIMNDGISEKLYISYRNQRFNYTLYNYDRAGNLIATIPPAGVSPLSNTDGVDYSRSFWPTGIILPNNTKTSTYKYNTLNQVFNQKTPDGGSTDFFYDAAGRVIFSQNAKQRETGNMTYTLYDQQGRIMETGMVKLSCVPYFEPYPSQNVLVPNGCSYYMDGMRTPFPPQVQQLKNYTHNEIVNYVRSFPREEVVLTTYDEPAIDMTSQAGMSPQENLRKRVSAIRYFDFLQPSNTTFDQYSYAMHFSYDIVGNVKTLIRDYPAWARSSQRFKRVDYDYDVISGKVNLLSYNRSFADQFYQKYTYDDDNRIVEVKTSNDGIIWERDAGYQYYQHGPLARMTLGELNVQGVDYAYTIQGWLKAVNGDLLDTAKDMGTDGNAASAYAKDAVALSLNYFNGDYKPIGTTAVTGIAAPAKNMYNGNIPAATTAISPYPTLDTRYVYDQLNRIIKAQYAYVNPYDGTMSNTADYYSSYAYDPDGNLKKLVRNGNAVGGSSQLMDSLEYHYQPNGLNNRLQNVTDYVDNNFNNDIKHYTNTGASRYLYDATGNVIKDLVSGQDTIVWNHYNKVMRTRNDLMGNKLLFAYDGAGSRYLKTVEHTTADSSGERSDYYVRDAQGNILAVYDQDEQYKMTKKEWIEYLTVDFINHGVSTNDFLSKVIKPYFATYGSFRYYVLGATMNDHFVQAIQESYPVSFFTTNAAVRSNLLAHAGEQGDFYGAMAAYTADSKPPVLADALNSLLQPNEDRNYTFLRELFGPGVDYDMKYKVLQLMCSNAGNLFTYVASGDYNLDSTDCATNVQRLADLFNSDPDNTIGLASEVANIVFNDVYPGRAGYLPFLRALATDTDVMTYEPYTSEKNNGVLLPYFRDALDKYGNPQALGNFFDSWEPSRSLLSSTTAPQVLQGIAFDNDAAGYLNTYISNYAGGKLNVVYDGLYTIPWLTPGHYIDRWRWSNVIVDSILHTEYSNVLQSERISLSEHHLYGSSRLGIKKYLPGQYYSLHDYSGSQTLADTTSLCSRKPWYSLEYNDAISGLALEPYGMAEVSSFYTDNVIGQRQYELTNHLGNVQATISDYPAYRGTDHNAALVSSYDYYPFGMLMPGRGSDSLLGQSNVQGNILLVSNDFSDGTVGSWQNHGTYAPVVENGRLRVNVSGYQTGTRINLSVAQGKSYRLRMTVDRDGNTADYQLFFLVAMPAWTAVYDNYPTQQITHVDFTFTAPSNQVTYFCMGLNDGEHFFIDDFILEEIKPQSVKQPTPQGDCITMTQPKWVPTLVDSCYYVSGWPWWNYHFQKVNGSPGTLSTAAVRGDEVLLSIASDENLNFNLSTVPNAQQTVEWEVSSYNSGGTMQFVETRDGVDVSLGSVNIKGAGVFQASILPTMSSIRAIISGPAQIGLRRFCVKRPGLKQENVLVTICPEDKDKYRFGFNGQEKVNEWSGIGNYLDYPERGYDSRIARWLSIDPLATKYPSISPYAYVVDNPIKYRDVDGQDVDVAIDGNTITFSSTIYIYGTNSQVLAASYQRAYDKFAQSALSNRTYVDGTKIYNVVFKMTFVPASSEDAERIRSNKNEQAAESLVALDPTVKRGNAGETTPHPNYRSAFYENPPGQKTGPSDISSGTSVSWGGTEPFLSIAHEIFHNWGLGDRYVEHPPQYYYMNQDKKFPANIGTVPSEGFDRFDIMVDCGVSSSNTFSQIHIDNLASKALSESNRKGSNHFIMGRRVDKATKEENKAAHEVNINGTIYTADDRGEKK